MTNVTNIDCSFLDLFITKYNDKNVAGRMIRATGFEMAEEIAEIEGLEVVGKFIESIEV